jgi:uncharacterized protein YndB with AHSA1/START domain
MSPKNEFVISRVIAAPRALVWKAWTDAEQLARWWGPRSFTNQCEIDLRPGGVFRVVMRSATGVDYPLKSVYREVVAPERLVYVSDLSEHPDEWHDLLNPSRDKSLGRPALESPSTVTFEEHDGQTRLTLSTVFESAALRDAFLKIGIDEGWSQSLERLTELLAS